MIDDRKQIPLHEKIWIISGSVRILRYCVESKNLRSIILH